MTAPISLFVVSEIEPVTMTGVFQRVRTIDEEHGITKMRRVLFVHQKSLSSGDAINVVFLTDFSKECLAITPTVVVSSSV